MSYEPYILPQSNNTLHNSVVFRKKVDLSQWGSQSQIIETISPHYSYFNIASIWIHADAVGFGGSAGSTGRPVFNVGFSSTSSARFLDFVNGFTVLPVDANRFVEVTLAPTFTTPGRPAPSESPIVLWVSTKAGTAVNTSANFTQPAVGSTVLVSLTPTAAWPRVGGTVYVGTSATARDRYTCTAVTGASPYASITLRLEESGLIAPGGTVPSGSNVVAAADFTIFVHGYFRRARWP